MITIVVRDCFIARKLNDNYCCEMITSFKCTSELFLFFPVMLIYVDGNL